MAPARALEALGRLFQRPAAPSDEELVAYADVVRPALDRAERLYEQWFERAAYLDDSEKLANAAAIQRWEAATMSRALDGVTPPAVLARSHAEVVAALAMASRAAQLLSNGRRFHSANAVCDGQTLLEASRKRRLAAAEAIGRLLARHDIPWGTPPEPPRLVAGGRRSLPQA